ncbi:MAG: DUF1819 family protein [Lachnospiraceae bacterium]
MEYSAGMVSCLFWLSETRKTAELMLQGKTIEKIRVLAITENIYQVKAADRAKRIAGVSWKRLSSLSKELLEILVVCDLPTAKLIVLLSIMKTDTLFFEFMHTVFKSAVILGEPTLSDGGINVFFDEKIRQSETVAAWSDRAIKKLKQTYSKLLIEAGLLTCASDKKIQVPMIDYKLRSIILRAGFANCLSTLTGEELDG